MSYQWIPVKSYLFVHLLLAISLPDNSCTMKALIQRVTNASVTVDGEVIASIGKGLCVLVGMHRNDTKKDLEFIVRKILNLKLFGGADDKRWCTSVVDNDLEILCVSQFTLYYTMKGHKADFHRAMAAEFSEPMYNDLLNDLRSQYKEDKVKGGKFGAMMQVQLVNDGPVTLQIESSPPKE